MEFLYFPIILPIKHSTIHNIKLHEQNNNLIHDMHHKYDHTFYPTKKPMSNLYKIDRREQL